MVVDEKVLKVAFNPLCIETAGKKLGIEIEVRPFNPLCIETKDLFLISIKSSMSFQSSLH